MKHPVLRLVAIVAALLFVVLVIGGVIVWLKIAGLKTQLAESLGHALGAKVEFTSLDLDVWKGELHAAGITLINQRPDAPWDRGGISQATVRFHLRDILSPTLPLSVEVDSWRVVLHPKNSNAGAPAAGVTENAEPASSAPSGKSRIQVTQLSALDGEVEIDLSEGRQIIIHGVAFNSTTDGGAVWTTQLRADSISAGSMQLGTSSVQIIADHDKATFSELRMQCAQGVITGNGEVGLNGSQVTQASLKAVDVPISMLVSVKWQMKLSGLATGTLNYHGDIGMAEAQGQVSIGNGKFNVLPFAGSLMSMVGLPDITNMDVDKATTNFDWKNNALHLTNIDVEKNDIIRITGAVDVGADNQVDGRLKLGLPATVLSRWPQLQTAVFSTNADNFDWTDVHLTGTPDHLQEDLTPRLMASAVQTGGTLLNQGVQKAKDAWKSFMGQ